MIAQLPLIGPPSDVEPGTPLVALWLDGQPQAWGQKCSCIGKVKPKPTARPEPHWRDWRDAMVEELLALSFVAPLVVPMIADVVAVFRRPLGKKTGYTQGKTWRPYPYPWTDGRVPFIGKPDFDNVWKATLDVLKHGRFIADDALVVGPARVGPARFYAAEGEDPHVEVRLWRA